MNEQDIKRYVENQFNINLNDTRRKRDIVYARVLFSKLCRERFNTPYEKLGKMIGMHHSSIVNYCKKLFKDIELYEPQYYRVYKNFEYLEDEINGIISVEDYEKKYKKLLDKYVKLKNSGDTNKFTLILDSVPDEKLDLFYTRIKPIAKMLNSHNVL